MRLAALAIVAVAALGLSACSKKQDTAANGGAENPAAANAAADAGNVASIPGYSPGAGNSTASDAGNVAAGNVPP